ncbi:MAG TPA: beta-ketoacyl synthase [Pseudomonadales bacterium]|nr:beta-ketoacyl synthase [Pseudomonadales bacterium]
MRLPVIVGLGGANPAGRLSSHHSYRRLVIDALSTDDAAPTWRALASMMGLTDGADPDASQRAFILDHTLVRRIESRLMNVDAIPCNRGFQLQSEDGGKLTFVTRRRMLPDVLPPGWTLSDVPGDDDRVRVETPSGLDLFLPDHRVSRVQAAGQLPTGFDPERLYQSRNHPRGLALSVFGASDALRSTGLEWDRIRNAVAPDEIAVYAGSGMSQLDQNGYAGMMQAQLIGKRATSKQLPLGLPEMPADFVNAYVLGSVGSTGTNIGACATYLYNLRQGIEDIRSGRRRVVFVGNAEAPITPEIIEGYRTMGALAEDEALLLLDGSNSLEGIADHRRACRPFSDNCGFTLSESVVFTVLMDDTLAMELGADILGAVADVFVNADGFKKSIPGPGIGNYLTVGKALATARAILGDEAVQRRSYMHTHGTGTPQNRVTESHIMNEMARTFGIDRWLLGAIKAYVGHSLSPAAGDQLAAALGGFRYGIIPGITTIDHIAEDVHSDNLEFPLTHKEVGAEAMDVAFLNSKGFGGNNATGAILAPHVVQRMLRQRHGAAAMSAWEGRHEKVSEAIADYDVRMTRGEVAPIYQFGEGVLDGTDLTISDREIRIPGFDNPVSLDIGNPYDDMTD